MSEMQIFHKGCRECGAPIWRRTLGRFRVICSPECAKRRKARERRKARHAAYAAAGRVPRIFGRPACPLCGAPMRGRFTRYGSGAYRCAKCRTTHRRPPA